MASALYQPPASSPTRRNGFRRRPARATEVRDEALQHAAAATPLASGAAVVIDAFDDFVHCTHPGCCALRPVGEGVRCPSCHRF